MQEILLLEKTVAATQAGDLGRAEAMLISQAQTLASIFDDLMRRSINQKILCHWDAYMRMGLRAQNQGRTTLTTLGEMMNPATVAFVKQANISHGPQQVNNGGIGSDTLPMRSVQPRAHEAKIEPAPNYPSALILPISVGAE